MTRFSQTNSASPFRIIHPCPLSISLPIGSQALISFFERRRDRGEETEYVFEFHIGSILANAERNGREVLSFAERKIQILSRIPNQFEAFSSVVHARLHTHTHSLSLSLSLSSRASLHREDISLRRSFSQSECSLISFEPFAPE